MSTLAELRSHVFLKLAEGSGATFTDAEILQFINREYKFLVTHVNQVNDEYFSKIQTTSTTTNELYAFPTDMVKLLMIELLSDLAQDRWLEVSKISIHRKEQYKFDQGIGTWSSGKLFYYVQGSNYGIVPKRKSAGSNDLKLWYVYLPIALSDDDDTPEIPPLYHELIELGAVNRARMAIKEPPIDQQMYSGLLVSMVETISPRVKHKPRQIRMVSGTY